MFLFRPHKELLDDAMKEVVELKDKDALVEHIKKRWEWCPNHGFNITKETIKIESYGGIDKRIGWDTYIVTLEDKGKVCVEGFTNSPVSN